MCDFYESKPEAGRFFWVASRGEMIFPTSHARGLIAPIRARRFFRGHYAKGRARMVLLTSLRDRLDDFSYITREVESFETNTRARHTDVNAASE